jgi:hypothetical protein
VCEERRHGVKWGAHHLLLKKFSERRRRKNFGKKWENSGKGNQKDIFIHKRKINQQNISKNEVLQKNFDSI